jgi:hypothetical protein
LTYCCLFIGGEDPSRFYYIVCTMGTPLNVSWVSPVKKKPRFMVRYGASDFIYSLKETACVYNFYD